MRDIRVWLIISFVAETIVGASYAVVIGDIVSSRSFEDQKSLIELAIETLDWVNETLPSVQPLEMTVGDELQGAYSNLGQALEAALYVQLRLKGDMDLRFGLGWGEISQFDPERAPMAQSGSAWWAAREALDSVSELGSKKLWPRTLTTRFRRGDVVAAASDPSSADLSGSDPVEQMVNSFLLCRDGLLARMDDRDARITLGLFRDDRQEDIAKELRISQSAVAQRVGDGGAGALFRAHQGLRGLLP